MSLLIYMIEKLPPERQISELSRQLNLRHNGTDEEIIREILKKLVEMKERISSLEMSK